MKRLRADRSRRRDAKEEDQKSDNESHFSFSNRLHLNSAVQIESEVLERARMRERRGREI